MASRETISNEMIVKSIFKVFRKDRSELTSNKGRGGGVLIATKQNMEVTEETRRKLNIMTLQQRRIMIDLFFFL